MSLRDTFMRDSKQDTAQPSTTFEADEFYSPKKLSDLSSYPDDLTRAKRIFFFGMGGALLGVGLRALFRPGEAGSPPLRLTILASRRSPY